MIIAQLSFWKATAERTIGTVAATAVTLIVGGENLPGVTDLDWMGVASVSATAGIVTILKALAATSTGPNPSFSNSESLNVDGVPNTPPSSSA